MQEKKKKKKKKGKKLESNELIKKWDNDDESDMRMMCHHEIDHVEHFRYSLQKQNYRTHNIYKCVIFCCYFYVNMH